MEENNIAYGVVDIDEDIEESMFLVENGYHTLPQVFDRDGNSLGGCDDFIANYKP